MNTKNIYKRILIGLILFSMIIPANNTSATVSTSPKKVSIIKSEVLPKEIVKGNTKYYINGQVVITSAKVYSGR
ncbi:hypothetical protein, partial [Neobacillus drentensis]|uniref:hypothetical protein n=1 Tax=Neobacillus drentensis TaxID=220684 RepID=UPI002FFE3F3F